MDSSWDKFTHFAWIAWMWAFAPYKNSRYEPYSLLHNITESNLLRVNFLIMYSMLFASNESIITWLQSLLSTSIVILCFQVASEHNSLELLVSWLIWQTGVEVSYDCRSLSLLYALLRVLHEVTKYIWHLVCAIVCGNLCQWCCFTDRFSAASFQLLSKLRTSVYRAGSFRPLRQMLSR